MILETNPVTSQLHDDWIKRIHKEFPGVSYSEKKDFLSIINYIDRAPQKYYSVETANKFLAFLERLKSEQPKLLVEFLTEEENFINISNKTLTEINKKDIHDTHVPKDHNSLLNFIDKEIHYSLLRLYESTLFHFTYLIAKYSRIKKSKGTAGLDLYNVMQEIKGGEFDFISQLYNNTIRNGIAHGKVIYTDLDNIYIDKKGNKESIPTRKIIELFDKTLDTSNGLCLAFKSFCFSNTSFLEKHEISIPHSILVEELQAKSNGPAWEITNCLESVALHNKRQLIVYVDNKNWDYSKVQWYCFTTAYWAERLTKTYDRIFFSLNSSHSYSGWAAFNAQRLRELREKKSGIESYTDVLEDNLIFFVPKFKFPKPIYKLGSFYSIVRTNFPIAWRNYRKSLSKNLFYIRDTQIHSNNGYTIINNVSVIINTEYRKDAATIITDNYKKIISKAIQYSKKQTGYLSKAKYLPSKYIKVFVFESDKRVRQLRHSGLIPELIATIELNSTNKIKSVDIYNGVPEQKGKYRIVWNKNWIER